MNDLSTALLITLVGMGMVFAIIVLLWGLIALLSAWANAWMSAVFR